MGMHFNLWPMREQPGDVTPPRTGPIKDLSAEMEIVRLRAELNLALSRCDRLEQENQRLRKALALESLA